MGDPLTYRTKEETEQARRHEPVAAFRRRLLDEGRAAEERIAEIESQVRARIGEAVEFALAGPEPELNELMTDIYTTEQIQAMVEESQSHE